MLSLSSVTVWTKSSDQFEKKTCGNKLELHDSQTIKNIVFFPLKNKYFIVMKKRVNKAAVSDCSSSDQSDALVTCHVHAASTTTEMDCGFRCHMQCAMIASCLTSLKLWKKQLKFRYEIDIS